MLYPSHQLTSPPQAHVGQVDKKLIMELGPNRKHLFCCNFKSKANLAMGKRIRKRPGSGAISQLSDPSPIRSVQPLNAHP